VPPPARCHRRREKILAIAREAAGSGEAYFLAAAGPSGLWFSARFACVSVFLGMCVFPPVRYFDEALDCPRCGRRVRRVHAFVVLVACMRALFSSCACIRRSRRSRSHSSQTRSEDRRAPFSSSCSPACIEPNLADYPQAPVSSSSSLPRHRAEPFSFRTHWPRPQSSNAGPSYRTSGLTPLPANVCMSVVIK
jgi:hypothetical protein